MHKFFVLFAALFLASQFQNVRAQTLSAVSPTQTGSCTTVDEPTSAETLPAIVETENRGEFDTTYPHAVQISLDKVAGRMAPFDVHGVGFYGPNLGNNPQVVSEIVNLPASFWFGAEATSSNFLLTNATVQIDFPQDVTAMGIDIQCFACDNPGQPTPITAIALDKNGKMLTYLQSFPTSLTSQSASVPTFLGYVADKPFHSIILQRSSNWMLMNLRYAPSQHEGFCR